MQDEDPTTPPIPVTVEVTSNEIEYGKVRMAEIAETKDLGSPKNKVHRAEVFLAPYTCHDERSESPRDCRAGHDACSGGRTL